jgi:hypothetical protein
MAVNWYYCVTYSLPTYLSRLSAQSAFQADAAIVLLLKSFLHDAIELCQFTAMERSHLQGNGSGLTLVRA